MQGCDVLPNDLVVIYPAIKPILIYKGIPELPPHYSALEIEAATNYMMNITNIPKE